MRSDPFAPYNVLRRDETELCLEVSKGYRLLYAVTYSVLPFVLSGTAAAWIVLIQQETELQLLWLGVALAIVLALILIFQKAPIRLTIRAFGIEIVRYHFLHRTSAISIPHADLVEIRYHIEYGKSRRGLVVARLQDGRRQVLVIIPPLELNEENLERAAAEIGRRLGMTAQKG